MIVGNFQGGGGVAFPSTPSAGDTPIYFNPNAYSTSDSALTDTGFGFTAVISATFRIFYMGFLTGAAGIGVPELQLKKNGVVVADSTVYALSVSKTIDVALSAGDVITLWLRSNYTGDNSRAVGTKHFTVAILAADIQTEISKIITPR